MIAFLVDALEVRGFRPCGRFSGAAVRSHQVPCDEKGEAEELSCNKLLVSVGRKPVTHGAGLEEAGVELDEKGRVRVDEEWRTNLPEVYAIGDLIHGPMLAHKAEDEGIAVIRMGLMSSPSLLGKGQIIAGPWHASFGSLVREAIHMDKIEPQLPPPGQAHYVQIRAPRREVSLVRGYKNQCLRLIESKIKGKVIRVLADDGVPPGIIEVDQL